MKIYSKIQKAIKEGGYKLAAERIIWASLSFVKPVSILPSFSHPISKLQGYPRLDFEVVELMQDEHEDDLLIAERILRAFNKSILKELEYQRITTKDAWDTIEINQHKELFEILESANSQKLVTYLRHMHTKEVTFGISDLNENDYKKESYRFRCENLAFIKDKIICLGEAVGALPYKGSGNLFMYRETDRLIQEIQTVLGINMSSSPVDAGLVKLKTNETSFCLRDLYSIYTAWRINQLVMPTDPIAEIGAGLGKTALYAQRFGFTDYSIFDLPQMNIIQSWFLIKSGVAVSLYGEEQQVNTVKILPWGEFNKSKTYALTVNVDSFTEMSSQIVRDYLNTIKHNTTKYLLSINHEKEHVYAEDTPTSSRLIVSKLAKDLSGLKLLYRFPFWLRRGYVEELYSLKESA
jgi:putative sugar O-methyltransferase